MTPKETFLRTIRQWLGTKIRYASAVLKIQEILLKNNRKYFSKTMFDELNHLPGITVNYTGRHLEFTVEGDPTTHSIALKAPLPEGADTINAHAILKYNFSIFASDLKEKHAQWERLLLDFEWQERLAEALIEYENTRKAMMEEVKQTGLPYHQVARMISSGLEHFFHEDLANKLQQTKEQTQ